MKDIISFISLYLFIGIKAYQVRGIDFTLFVRLQWYDIIVTQWNSMNFTSKLTQTGLFDIF